MSEYLAMLQQLHLPHLLIIAGAALVLVGAVGIVLSTSRDVDDARGIGATTASPGAVKARRERTLPNQPLPHDEDMSELLD